MKKKFIKAAILSVLAITGCTSVSIPPPLDVGDQLVVPADHTFVIPPEGIRFSNRTTVGVQPN